MLKIEHLTKVYGEKRAVDDLSLHIRPGEIYGFIGHNGAGKTTTLKYCCGILQFDSGEIMVDGVSMKTNPLICIKKIAYIPDNPDLYEFMTGIRYLNFVADILGVGAAERREHPPLCRCLRTDRRSVTANFCVLAWHKAEAGSYFRTGTSATAHYHG